MHVSMQCLVALMAATLAWSTLQAQQGFTDAFPPEEIARRSTLFLMPNTPLRESQIGPILGVNQASVRLTGLDVIAPRDSFAVALARIAADGRAIYTPFRPEVLGSESADDVQRHTRATKDDPWDGRISREEAFIAHLKGAAARSPINDLDPILDSLRAVKSPREIAVIREATRLAGLGIMEVMRDAEPGPPTSPTIRAM